MKTISRGDWAIDILTCCRFEQSETSAGSCILTLIWTDPKVVGVFRARLTGKVLVRGARSKWNRLQPGEGAAELLRPRPAFRKMQGQPACRAGEPSGDREEPPPEGLGGHHLLTRTDARCPAGQVCAITWTASQAALAAKRQGCGIGVPWASWKSPRGRIHIMNTVRITASINKTESPRMMDAIIKSAKALRRLSSTRLVGTPLAHGTAG